tara:strand:+ start:734 stop:1150 length:417 start_codon:yes stop_codon:yes gene_type:complete
MKLHILRQDQEPVGGYEVVRIEPNQLQLGHIVDNQCEEILAPDVSDSFHISTIQQVVDVLLSKLRRGGSIVLGGTDVRLFAKSIYNGVLNHDSAANIVGQVQSMVNPDLVKALMMQRGVTVDSVRLDGIHYEIKGTRN